MAVLLSLVLGSLAARVVGWLGVDYVDTWPAAIAVGLAVMFVTTGGPTSCRGCGATWSRSCRRGDVPLRVDAGDVPGQRIRPE
jgi:hypothetical protein